MDLLDKTSKEELIEPIKPLLLDYFDSEIEYDQINEKFIRESCRFYLRDYIVDVLWYGGMTALFMAVFQSVGLGVMGFMLALGIRDGNSFLDFDLSSKSRDRKFSKVEGATNFKNYQKALSEYESEHSRYKWEKESLEHAEKRERKKKEREEKRLQYDYWINIDPYEFEKELAVLFGRIGYDARVTKGSDDGGIDINLRRGGRSGIVQCKRYSSKVGPAQVRELYGALIHGNYSYAYLVCPSGFSEKAYTFSKGKPIRLVGLKRIIEMSNSSQCEWVL